MQLAVLPNLKARLLRAVAGQRWIAACPQRLNHVLLLADRHLDSQEAIDFAVELAEHFSSRLTLMHGGDLRPDAALLTSDSLEAPNPDQARLALLCLLGDVRKCWPEVGLCSMGARSPKQVFQAAAQQKVDLLVLPAGLFGPFLPLVGRSSGQEEMVEGAPCPVLVVDDSPQGIR